MSQVVQEAITKEELKKALKNLGVGGNMIIEVHSSLSSFGYVVGGARTVVDALMELCEDGGTLLMPIQAVDNTDPSNWQNPPVSPELWRTIRENFPAFDPKTSDIRYMGSVVENFRHREDVVFSSHPTMAYAAWGRYAKLLCNRQSTHFPLAEESPSARLYELKGNVLLLGVGFDRCTCLHLAQYRAESRPIVIEGASAKTLDGQKEWKKYLNLDLDTTDFEKIQAMMYKKELIKQTTIGSCQVQFFSAVHAIDEATKYFEKTAIYDLYR